MIVAGSTRLWAAVEPLLARQLSPGAVIAQAKVTATREIQKFPSHIDQQWRARL